MVLKIIFFILISNPIFSQTQEDPGFINLKTSIIKLENEDISEISSEEVDSIKKTLSDLEEIDTGKLGLDEWDERLNSITDKMVKRKFIGNWNLFLGWMTWTDEDQEILSQENGPCLGGGYDRQNHWFGYGIDLCFGNLNAKEVNQSNDQNSSESDFSITLINTRPKIFWRPDKHVRLILFLPVIYRNGGPDNSHFNFGSLIGAEWETSGIVIGSSLGKIIGFQSSGWNITLGYRF